MFNFLKKKLKNVVENFSKKAEEDVEKGERKAEEAAAAWETPLKPAEEAREAEKAAEAKEKPEEETRAAAEEKDEAVSAGVEKKTGEKRKEEAAEKTAAAEEEKQTSEKESVKAPGASAEAVAIKKQETEKAAVEEAKEKTDKKQESRVADNIAQGIKEESEVHGQKPKGEIADSFRSNIEEIRADLKRKEEEISAEDKRQKGVLGKVSAIFRKKEAAEEKKEDTGIFSKITGAVTTTKISEDKFDNLFEEMELVLLENNVAMEVIDKIRADLKASIVGKPLSRGKVGKIVSGSLRDSIQGLFNVEKTDLMEKVRGKKPFVIMFAGINGSGKTTSIAKVAKHLQDGRLKVVMAASDTFRAAAIQQLQEHADRLGIKLIKHDYGSDPAAVAFDAIKYAQAKDADAVLIDTAGRQHSNANLMDEMKKIVRVSKPDMKIFVGESITGNDCVEQAKQFNEAIGIDGIILAKADVDEKGGAAISVSYVTRKPILYLGTGQKYEDLTPFRPELVVESLGLAA